MVLKFKGKFIEKINELVLGNFKEKSGKNLRRKYKYLMKKQMPENCGKIYELGNLRNLRTHIKNTGLRRKTF